MNEIKLLQFLTTDDDKFSRSQASSIVRSYTSRNTPIGVSTRALAQLGSKPMNYNAFKANPASKYCVWEHAVPVNELVSTIFINPALIESTLKNAPICIVTNAEDSDLTAHGFRQTRDNWQEAYHKVGIELVNYFEGDELAFYKSFYEMNFKDKWLGALRERDQFVESNDTLGSFLKNNNVQFTGNGNDFIITKELREAYNAYNIDEEGGKNELSSRAFVPALRAKRQGKYFDTGTKKINGKTTNIIKGIKWDAPDSNIFG